MTIVDLAKARAYAATGLTCTDTAADWILSLADEVESLTRALEAVRRSEQAALADAATLQAERDAAVAGLRGLYEDVVKFLKETSR